MRPAYAAIAEVYAALSDWPNAAQFYKKQAQAEAAVKETVLDGYINNLETLLELNHTRRLAEQDMLTGVLIGVVSRPNSRPASRPPTTTGRPLR